MQPLIKLEKVSRIYQHSNLNVAALKEVTLSIEKGERIAIIGASGSGKSTLMNIIGLLDKPTSGRYFFEGISVDQLTSNEIALYRGRKIGFVFQSFFLLPRLNAIENVMLPLLYQEIETKIANEKAREMLDLLQMSKLAHHKPSELSGGQMQRVAIARALIANPEIVLADEPTGALDSATGNEVMKLLIKLNEEAGRTLLIITHDQAISQQCKRIIAIKDGCIRSENE